MECELSEDSDLVKVTINGKDIETSPGRLLIDVAEEHDVFVPRFCYHPGLEPVAACRMCLVQIEGSRRPLDPACATQIADGMVVHTDSAEAVQAQESVLELLLINHPLDCPICDRGGECPLQDQTLKFGPGQSRYREEKRHYPKALPISDLVVLDRERCVLCWRCVRFCDEVSGDQFIDLMDRGSHTQINTAPDAPFDSYFSGNTIQVCPVGALTSRSYRFLSRPWDLGGEQTTCSFCSVGCPISLEQRAGEVLRAQALPNENVNSFWICDKGRFGHRYVSHPDRLKGPLIRKKGEGGDVFEETSWKQALGLVAEQLRSLISSGDGRSAGLIGGSHTTNEDLYAASRFFRDVVGSPNLDFRTFDAGFPYEQLATHGVVGSSATINDLVSAETILWIGPDPKEELPVLYLRIREAVEKGARLIVLHPRTISLSELGTQIKSSPAQQGQELLSLISGSGVHPEVTEALKVDRLVVCAGQQFIGISMHETVDALSAFVGERPKAKLLLLVPNANSQGAIDMGVTPHFDAGHRRAADGLDARKMLIAAAEGKLKFLWLMGADLLSDFPDADLVKRAMDSGAFIVASDLFATRTARSASVVLPAESFAEKDGSFTNLERRIQRVRATVPAPGVARADWRMFADLSQILGRPTGWHSSEDVARAIATGVPTHADFSWDQLGGQDIPKARIGERQAEGSAWPLSWELRAIDATRYSGYVWPLPSDGDPARATPAQDAPAFASSEFPLTLLASRAIYDEGQMVSRSPELRNVTPKPHVELHPEEAAGRGLNDGDVVTVRSSSGSLSLRLRISQDTPPGAASMLFDQPGANANVLIDITKPLTLVQVVR